MSKKIIVSGVGCCLVDVLYNNISFSDPAFQQFRSIQRGDGGLTPGRLVFKEEFEQFAGTSFENHLPYTGTSFENHLPYTGTTFEYLVQLITGPRTPDKITIGGPSIVALIHAAQLCPDSDCEVRFYGKAGNDEKGRYLLKALISTPVVLCDFTITPLSSPSTIVLSDPTYDNGHGERTFIHSMGAAADYKPEELDESFFNSHIAVFGGTALVPQIHDGLTGLLKKSKARGSITVVNTVFDFRNEKQNPDKKWPLGNSDESFAYIDLLIADHEEALRLSGASIIEDAIEFFINNKVAAALITNGSKPVHIYSGGTTFAALQPTQLPISQRITEELTTNNKGDTTGAGDNFAGGVIASIANQLKSEKTIPDLLQAASWGVVSGGYACFYVGGTYLEQSAGEKLNKLLPYYNSYLQQLNG